MADRNLGLRRCASCGPVAGFRDRFKSGAHLPDDSYVFDDTDHAASLFNLQTFGNVYSRMMNPTSAVLEERLATLEGGRAGWSLDQDGGSDGRLLPLAGGPGDELVSPSTLYGGTYSQFDYAFRRMGIDTHFFDPDDPQNFPKGYYLQDQGSLCRDYWKPAKNVLDISAVAAIAQMRGYRWLSIALLPRLTCVDRSSRRRHRSALRD
ncbi:MAG: hypothetical protein CM1200mP18_07570 [Gammaproteobacteria bacterium]|nr:MAG: hypothetical protein CM1200mP18_07570 [Gammaproteobacteria bacterium]